MSWLPLLSQPPPPVSPLVMACRTAHAIIDFIAAGDGLGALMAYRHAASYLAASDGEGSRFSRERVRRLLLLLGQLTTELLLAVAISPWRKA